MVVKNSDKLVLSSDSVKNFLHTLSCGLKDVEDGNIYDIETLWTELDEELWKIKKHSYED